MGKKVFFCGLKRARRVIRGGRSRIIEVYRRSEICGHRFFYSNDKLVKI